MNCNCLRERKLELKAAIAHTWGQERNVCARPSEGCNSQTAIAHTMGRKRGSAAAPTEHSTWRKRVHASRVTATARKCAWRKRIHVHTGTYIQTSNHGLKNALDNHAKTGVQWMETRPQIMEEKTHQNQLEYQNGGPRSMPPPRNGTTTRNHHEDKEVAKTIGFGS